MSTPQPPPQPLDEKLDDRLRSAVSNLAVEGLNATPDEIAEARRRLLHLQSRTQ